MTVKHVDVEPGIFQPLFLVCAYLGRKVLMLPVMDGLGSIPTLGALAHAKHPQPVHGLCPSGKDIVPSKVILTDPKARLRPSESLSDGLIIISIVKGTSTPGPHNDGAFDKI
jgi:hypothetical protein